MNACVMNQNQGMEKLKMGSQGNMNLMVKGEARYCLRDRRGPKGSNKGKTDRKMHAIHRLVLTT